jgi:hypothetical protein
MSKVVNRPSGRGTSGDAISPCERDFIIGHKDIWGAMPIVPRLRRPETGCNRPDQGRSTGDKKPIFSPVVGVDLCRTSAKFGYVPYMAGGESLEHQTANLALRSSNLFR